MRLSSLNSLKFLPNRSLIFVSALFLQRDSVVDVDLLQIAICQSFSNDSFSKSQPFTATSTVNARSSINRRLKTKIQEKWASCPQCQTGGHLPHNKKPSPPARLKTEACPHNGLPDLKITNYPQDLQTSRCTLLRTLLVPLLQCRLAVS